MGKADLDGRCAIELGALTFLAPLRRHALLGRGAGRVKGGVRLGAAAGVVV